MATLEELRAPFAVSIHAKAGALRQLNLTKSQRARLLEAVSDDIRKFTDLIPPQVSIAAKTEADRRGVDLRDRGWHQQHKFDPGRTVFSFEHLIPVESVRAKCLVAGSPEDVARILAANSRTVWILRRENEKLNALGYHKDRPDPDLAYRQAGIEIYQG